MMEAVGADDRIKSSFIKRQIFTVADQKLRVGEIFCLCDMDHLRRKIQSDIVFVRVLVMEQFEHGTGAATAIEDICKCLLFQFCQDRRIIILAHFINTGVSAVIDLGCLSKFFDGKFLIFFRCHQTISLCILLVSHC